MSTPVYELRTGRSCAVEGPCVLSSTQARTIRHIVEEEAERNPRLADLLIKRGTLVDWLDRHEDVA